MEAQQHQISSEMYLLPWHTLVGITQSLDDLVITRIRCGFIEKADRLPIQSHILPLETQVANPGHVLFAITVIVFEEEIDGRCRIPKGSVQSYLGNIVASRKLDRLGRLEICRYAEIKILAIPEQLELSWRRG